MSQQPMPRFQLANNQPSTTTNYRYSTETCMKTNNSTNVNVANPVQFHGGVSRIKSNFNAVIHHYIRIRMFVIINFKCLRTCYIEPYQQQ
ncbi:hypothetical protein BLA29_008615 [Euroglyphus maynei]|uniref:Uncharacterized protein n=1 Tax=Euroglyphus maynei TaxID=6958 RepID=A0A1Y3BJB1_EURMA|nr:hypothetical protein BLA29_008615 [Euroglyphus maynei]